MPYAGPYIAPNPFIPYSPPTIWPQVQPYSPWPNDVYIGDPLPGQSTITICSTTAQFMN